MLYKRFKLSCYQLVIKGTLFGKQYAMSAFSGSIRGIFLKIYSTLLPFMRYKRGCDLSITMGNLLGEESTFSVYLAFYWKDLTGNSHLTLSAYALHTHTPTHTQKYPCLRLSKC